MGANSSLACVQCPEYTTTTSSGAISEAQCKCMRSFVRLSNETHVACSMCPPGAACDDIGTTLQNLRVLRGYWRPSKFSRDVVRCMDAASNCSSAVCPDSTSGCLGGVDSASLCEPSLEGPFCLLCAGANRSREPGSNVSLWVSEGLQYYVPATSNRVAHCQDCGNIKYWVWISAALLSVVIMLSASAAMVGRRWLQAARRPGSTTCWCDVLFLLASGLINPVYAFLAAADFKQIINFLLIATAVGDVYEIECAVDGLNHHSNQQSCISLALTGLLSTATGSLLTSNGS